MNKRPLLERLFDYTELEILIMRGVAMITVVTLFIAGYIWFVTNVLKTINACN